MKEKLWFGCSTFLLIVLPSLAQPRGMKPIPVRDRTGNEVLLYRESHALVVGVSDYTEGWDDLPGVQTDVDSVRAVLEAHGFNVEIVKNPDDAALRNAYRDFINRHGYEPENRLLFYFAGHASTLGTTYSDSRRMGYLVPSNAPLPSADEFEFRGHGLDMDQVEVYAKQIQAKHVLFVFDACFAGVVFEQMRSDVVPAIISYKTARPVRQFITSGDADEPVPDRSLFRRQFTEGLRGAADTDNDRYVTGLELGEFLQRTVVGYTSGLQHPQHGRLRDPDLDKGDFVFVLPRPAPPPETHFDISDLEQMADEEVAGLKQRWEKWQSRMEADFARALQYGQRSAAAQAKADAWGRFLTTYAVDNTLIMADEDLRQRARAQQAYWVAQQAQRPAATEGMEEPPLSNEELAEVSQSSRDTLRVELSESVVGLSSNQMTQELLRSKENQTGPSLPPAQGQLLGSAHVSRSGFFDASMVADILSFPLTNLDELPEVYYDYHVLHNEKLNRLLARTALYKLLGNGDIDLGTRRSRVLELLNRVFLGELNIGDTLVVPTEFEVDFRAYSPFPRYYPGGREFNKLLVIHREYQAFAAYEHGRLARWGLANTGVPEGRYNVNWKAQHVRSDKGWEEASFLNFDYERNRHFSIAPFRIQGESIDGSVVFLDLDAQWIFEWAEAWQVGDPITHFADIEDQGTTLLVVGSLPKSRPTWFEFRKRYPAILGKRLPVHPYEVKAGTPQQVYFDRLRSQTGN